MIQGFMVRTLKIDTKMDCFVLNFHLILEDPGKINIPKNISRYKNKNSPKFGNITQNSFNFQSIEITLKKEYKSSSKWHSNLHGPIISLEKHQ